MYMGLINAIRSNYDEALKLYESMAIRTPAFRERRAFVFYKLGKMSKAIKDIKKLEEGQGETAEIMEIKACCEALNF